jgi:hypothetical protein
MSWPHISTFHYQIVRPEVNLQTKAYILEFATDNKSIKYDTSMINVISHRLATPLH